jgi:hypothetical protein
MCEQNNTIKTKVLDLKNYKLKKRVNVKILSLFVTSGPDK